MRRTWTPPWGPVVSCWATAMLLQLPAAARLKMRPGQILGNPQCARLTRVGRAPDPRRAGGRCFRRRQAALAADGLVGLPLPPAAGKFLGFMMRAIFLKNQDISVFAASTFFITVRASLLGQSGAAYLVTLDYFVRALELHCMAGSAGCLRAVLAAVHPEEYVQREQVAAQLRRQLSLSEGKASALFAAGGDERLHLRPGRRAGRLVSWGNSSHGGSAHGASMSLWGAVQGPHCAICSAACHALSVHYWSACCRPKLPPAAPLTPGSSTRAPPCGWASIAATPACCLPSASSCPSLCW